MNSLHTEISRFRAWASDYPVESRSGEWECDYPDWRAILTSFKSFLENSAPAAASNEVIQDLIYIIARDNEMEELVSMVAQSPAWLEFLLPSVLASDESDAQWQFASILGSLSFPMLGADSALLALFESQNEYVSRMALHALGERRHPDAEALCGRAWNTGNEYQRIMALWVLKEIDSPQLSQYLQAAKADGRKYVVQNAEKIEAL